MPADMSDIRKRKQPIGVQVRKKLTESGQSEVTLYVREAKFDGVCGVLANENRVYIQKVDSDNVR